MTDAGHRRQRFEGWSGSVAEAERLCAPVSGGRDFADVLAGAAQEVPPGWLLPAAQPVPGGGLDDVEHLLDGDIASAAAALRGGRVTAAALSDAARGRLRAIAQALNAVVHVDGDATGQGGDAGDLSAIPLAHKDMFHAPPRRSACGSDLGDALGPQDRAAVLERLDAAGAVNLGALSMTEIAFDPSGCNPVKGDCRNPWGEAFITGGSSSGSGVAVATGAVFGAFGSDTGGSIRLPAALCGVTGLKPTFGRISRHGAMVLSASHDHVGPLARSARDCAVLYRATAGVDPRDPATRHAPAVGAVPDAPQSLHGVRVGVDTGFFRDGLAPEVAQLIDASLAVFTQAGATVVEVPAFPYALVNSLAAMMVRMEAGALYGPALRAHPERVSPALADRLRAAEGFPPELYTRAEALRGAILARFLDTVMAGVDVLHLPIAGIVTPTRAAAAADGAPDFAIGTELTRLTRPINFLGLPALAVPCGRCAVAGTAGLPTAFQLVGRPWREDVLLALGAHYQGVTGWHRDRPPAPWRAQ